MSKQLDLDNEFFNSIEKLRQKLLDLTGRNNFISFKHSTRSKKQIRVIDEDPDQIFIKFLNDAEFEIIGIPVPDLEPQDEKTESFKKILNEKKKKDLDYLKALDELGVAPNKRKLQALEFELRNRIRTELKMPVIERGKRPPLPTAAERMGLNPNYELAFESNAKKHKDNFIQTLYYQDELEIMLESVYEQRKLVESETGTEPLYIAMGFVEWFESENSDKAIQSPLIFLPVTLEKVKAEKNEKVKHKFIIKLRETEAYFNFSLKERFLRDFNLKLPELEYTEDDETFYVVPSEYYKKLNKIIKENKDWSVKNWATLSFFSFSKLAMYQELERSKLENICTDGTPLESLIYGADVADRSLTFALDYNVEDEDIKHKVPHLISIADTSQISAIMDANEGKNLVIEGPPGTGKSQTITNMIATLIDSGKTVLFVAEKKAALTVVRDRLEQTGLGPFCLELHSGKSKKTEVLKSLHERLELKQKRPKNKMEDVSSNIDELKSKISKYLDFLNGEYSPLGVSLQDVMWTLLNIKYKNPKVDALVNICEIDELDKLTKWDIQKIEMTLNTLSSDYDSQISGYQFIENHPWFNNINPEILNLDIPQYLVEFKKIHLIIVELDSLVEKISTNEFQNLTLESAKEMCTRFSDFAEYKDLNISWAYDLFKLYGIKTSEKIKTVIKNLNQKNESLNIIHRLTTAKDVDTSLMKKSEHFVEQIKLENLSEFSKTSLLNLKDEVEEEKEKFIQCNVNSKLRAVSLNTDKRNQQLDILKNTKSSFIAESEKLKESVIVAIEYYKDITSILGTSEKVSFKSFNKIQKLKQVFELCPIDKWNLKDNDLFDLTLRSALRKILTSSSECHKLKEKLKNTLNIETKLTPFELRKFAGDLSNKSIFRIFDSDYKAAKKVARTVFLVALEIQEQVSHLNELADYLEKKELLLKVLNRNPKLAKIVDSEEEPDFIGLDEWIAYYDALQIWSNDYIFGYESVTSILSLDVQKIMFLKQKINEDHVLNHSEFKIFVQTDDDVIEDLPAVIEASKLTYITEIEEKIAQAKNNYAQLIKDELATLDKAFTEGLEQFNSTLKRYVTVLNSASDISAKEDIPFNELFKLTEAIETNLEHTLNLESDEARIILKSVPDLAAIVSSNEVENLEVFIKISGVLKLSDEEMLNILSQNYKEWFSATQVRLIEISNFLNSIDTFFSNWEVQRIDNGGLTTKQVIRKIELALSESQTISGYIGYCKSYCELTDYGTNLRKLLDLSKRNPILMSNLFVAFRIAYYTSVIKKFTKAKPAYFKSVSSVFDGYREKFRVLDNELSEAYRIHLYNKLSKQIPLSGNSRGKKSEFTETGLIEYQIKLKRPSVSVRSLMRRAPKSMQTLKPVFLMSPLSVAQLLPEKEIQFDVVIMDEASQMKPEDSLGSIARAKQVIIVGDPKQMPPSDFFNRNADGNSDGDEEDYIEVQEESILDLGLNIFKPARRLKWHYRSRSEKLIAFSNHHFYDGDLIIFPSAYNSDIPMGVKYEGVNGIYSKGTNPIEARETIERAIGLIKKYPTKSIMVVAMNQAQSELMQEVFSEREKNDPIIEEYKAYFENTLEPFLIRNLENVQGDERDIVIISTVYGPDSNGHVFQRFGPINAEYGHRRLNVLFTRAKYFMCIISSLDPDKIAVTNTSTQGVAAFKNFLSYAKTGRLSGEVISAGDREPDSDFEVFVAQRLKEKMPHLQIIPQIGVAGFYIDIGIRHPEKEGAYLLGIECDGKTYHSAKSARDRDKIRQKVLEDLGWNLYRIWSTDWFNNPDNEIKKLIEKINYLLKAS